MNARAMVFRGVLLIILLTAGIGAFIGLSMIRSEAARAAQIDQARELVRLAAAPAEDAPPSCAYPQDMNEQKLSDIAQTAAQAVGVELSGQSVTRAPDLLHPDRVGLVLSLETSGPFDATMNFLRLALVSNASIQPEKMELKPRERGGLSMKLTARATCRL